MLALVLGFGRAGIVKRQFVEKAPGVAALASYAPGLISWGSVDRAAVVRLDFWRFQPDGRAVIVSGSLVIWHMASWKDRPRTRMKKSMALPERLRWGQRQ